MLTVGSGSLTIANGKGKKLNITDSSGETKTYKFTSTVNNPIKSFEERWFMDSPKVETQNSELTSILNNDSNAINIDYKFDIENKFTQPVNIISGNVKSLKK